VLERREKQVGRTPQNSSLKKEGAHREGKTKSIKVVEWGTMEREMERTNIRK